MKRDLKLHRI